jgi:hypothetical protein
VRTRSISVSKNISVAELRLSYVIHPAVTPLWRREDLWRCASVSSALHTACIRLSRRVFVTSMGPILELASFEWDATNGLQNDRMQRSSRCIPMLWSRSESKVHHEPAVCDEICICPSSVPLLGIIGVRPTIYIGTKEFSSYFRSLVQCVIFRSLHLTNLLPPRAQAAPWPPCMCSHR